MFIRKYESTDCREVMALFYQTVHSINRKDYTKAQLDAWATGREDPGAWNRALQEHFSLVAVDDEEIVGFGDIEETGYLDRLYVQAAHQGRGIASALCDQLEQAVPGNILTRSSITARGFFEKRGYHLVRGLRVQRHGIFLPAFVMEKVRKPVSS